MLESIAVLAIVVERITELVFGTAFDKVPKLAPFKWALMYIAIILGVAAALTFQLDLLSAAGLPASVLGQILTGVAIGGGANFVHDLFAP